MSENPHRIGNMNGGWAVLLKISLSTYPIILVSMISFAAWNVRMIYSVQMRIGIIETAFAEKEYVNIIEKRVLIVEEAARRIQSDSQRAADHAQRNAEKLDRILEMLHKDKP